MSFPTPLRWFSTSCPLSLSKYSWGEIEDCASSGTSGEISGEKMKIISFNKRWLRPCLPPSRGLHLWDEKGPVTGKSNKVSGLFSEDSDFQPYTIFLSLRINHSPSYLKNRIYNLFQIGESPFPNRLSITARPNCCHDSSNLYCLLIEANPGTQASRKLSFHKVLPPCSFFILCISVDEEGDLYCYLDLRSLEDPSFSEGHKNVYYPGKFSFSKGIKHSPFISLPNKSFLSQIPPGVLNPALDLRPTDLVRSFFLRGDGPVTLGGGGPITYRDVAWFKESLSLPELEDFSFYVNSLHEV